MEEEVGDDVAVEDGGEAVRVVVVTDGTARIVDVG